MLFFLILEIDAEIFLSQAKFVEDDVEMISLSLLFLIFVIRVVVTPGSHGWVVSPSVGTVSISEMRRFLADLGAAASDVPATRYDVQNFFPSSLSLSLYVPLLD